MPDILEGLMWVQTVCRGYQQKTKVVTSGEKDKIATLYEFVSSMVSPDEQDIPRNICLPP